MKQKQMIVKYTYQNKQISTKAERLFPKELNWNTGDQKPKFFATLNLTLKTLEMKKNSERNMTIDCTPASTEDKLFSSYQTGTKGFKETENKKDHNNDSIWRRMDRMLVDNVQFAEFTLQKTFGKRGVLDSCFFLVLDSITVCTLDPDRDQTHEFQAIEKILYLYIS